jgi:hypothetical protein
MTTKTDEGVCQTCADVCHKGHHLRKVASSRFCCDCQVQPRPLVPGGSCLACRPIETRAAFVQQYERDHPVEPDNSKDSGKPKLALKPSAVAAAASTSKAASTPAPAAAAKVNVPVSATPVAAAIGSGVSSRSASAAQVVDDPTLAIIADCKRRGVQKWTDPEFQGAQALFKDPSKPKRVKWKSLQWKRPEEFVVGGKKPELYVSSVDPDDIKQGQVGDCWFLSAVSVLCKKPEVAQRIFINKTTNSFGVYCVQFYKNGKRVQVLVDDSFPVLANGKPAFAKSSQPNELWVSLIEKAFAKLHHDYESIESGFTDQALADLTGGIAMRIDVKSANADIRSGVLWKKMLDYRQNGFLMGAGTPAGSDSVENASPLGIVQGHAYSLLDVQEVCAYFIHTHVSH